MSLLSVSRDTPPPPALVQSHQERDRRSYVCLSVFLLICRGVDEKSKKVLDITGTEFSLVQRKSSVFLLYFPSARLARVSSKSDYPLIYIHEVAAVRSLCTVHARIETARPRNVSKKAITAGKRRIHRKMPPRAYTCVHPLTESTEKGR